MAKSIDTMSTKSSVVSRKTSASLEKPVKKSAAAAVRSTTRISRPSKRFKQSLSTQLTTRSTTSGSRSSTAYPPSNRDANSDNEVKTISDNGSAHGSESEPEVELTPKQELGMSLLIYFTIQS